MPILQQNIHLLLVTNLMLGRFQIHLFIFFFNRGREQTDILTPHLPSAGGNESKIAGNTDPQIVLALEVNSFTVVIL